MTPQVKHALRQYVIALAAVVLAFLVENQTGILDLIFGSIGLDPAVRSILEPSILAAIGYSVRWIEGLRDASRAESGKLIEADVAYDIMVDFAENPSVPQVWETPDGAIHVDTDAQVFPEVPAITYHPPSPPPTDYSRGNWTDKFGNPNLEP